MTFTDLSLPFVRRAQLRVCGWQPESALTSQFVSFREVLFSSALLKLIKKKKKKKQLTNVCACVCSSEYHKRVGFVLCTHMLYVISRCFSINPHGILFPFSSFFKPKIIVNF
jgi:hypothetical protein